MRRESWSYRSLSEVGVGGPASLERSPKLVLMEALSVNSLTKGEEASVACFRREKMKLNSLLDQLAAS